LEWGDIQTGFKKDTVYQAQNDGFLTVQYTSITIGGDYYVIVFSDNNSNPITQVGLITYPGTLSIPIKKNNFWKIVQGKSLNTNLLIHYTPIVKAN
jgi:hypothetical protein